MDNDDKERQLTHEVDVTQAEIDAHVWGPFKFVHGADGADAHGRSVASFALTVGRGRPFAMVRTDPGHWMGTRTRDQRQEEYRGHPVRLRITCRRGAEEWALARQVPKPVQIGQQP
ncbi:hypothetical protein OG937_45185 [Streptomyces sp. NBC_00510]